MRWKENEGTQEDKLEVVDEFRSFVKPSWRPILSDFCMELTGITQVCRPFIRVFYHHIESNDPVDMCQTQVDSAPHFPQVLESFAEFLIKNGLIDQNRQRIKRFCWCTDGPFD